VTANLAMRSANIYPPCACRRRCFLLSDHFEDLTSYITFVSTTMTHLAIFLSLVLAFVHYTLAQGSSWNGNDTIPDCAENCVIEAIAAIPSDCYERMDSDDYTCVCSDCTYIDTLMSCVATNSTCDDIPDLLDQIQDIYANELCNTTDDSTAASTTGASAAATSDDYNPSTFGGGASSSSLTCDYRVSAIRTPKVGRQEWLLTQSKIDSDNCNAMHRYHIDLAKIRSQLHTAIAEQSI
jgi:hypothetical protein